MRVLNWGVCAFLCGWVSCFSGTIVPRKARGTFSRCGAEPPAAFSREEGSWTAAKPGEKPAPASSVRIREFLSALASAEAIDFAWPTGAEGEPASATATLLAGYGLDPDSALAFTFRGAGRQDAQVAFGKDAGDGRAFALVQNGAAVALVDSRLRELAASDFLDPRLFPCDASSVSRVSVSCGGVECLLSKDAGGAWRLESPVAAPADAAAVRAFIDAALALKAADRYDGKDAVRISLSTNSAPVSVRREAVFAGRRPEDFRSLSVFPAKSGAPRRLSALPAGAAAPTVVAAGPAQDAPWIVESAPVPSQPVQTNIAAVVAALQDLEASEIVSLKTPRAALAKYGLEKPVLVLGADFPSGDPSAPSRKNIMLGAKASDGRRYATLGAFDAVFAISSADAEILEKPLAVPAEKSESAQNGRKAGTK